MSVDAIKRKNLEAYRKAKKLSGSLKTEMQQRVSRRSIVEVKSFSKKIATAKEAGKKANTLRDEIRVHKGK